MLSHNRRANHRLNHQNRRHIQFAPILEQLEARRLLAADLQLDYQQPAAAWYARWNHETLQAAAVAAGAPTDEWFSEFVGPRLYQRNDWIVRLTAEATQSLASIEQAKAFLNQNHIEFQIVAGLGLPGLLHVHTLSRSAAEVETSLATNSRVASFAANDKVGGQVIPNDSDFGNMTGLNNVGQFGATNDADIDAPEAWDTTRGSPSVVVGVVDSGIDATHPDLYLNIWLNQGEIPAAKRSALIDTDSDSLFTFYDLNNAANAAQVRDLNTNGYIDAIDLLEDPLWADGRDTDGNGFTDDFFGWNFRTDSNETFAPNNPSDVLGHGTHVAGTIGAIGNNARGVTGINWRSSVMALKFLDENNQGDTASAIAAVNYATMMRTQFNTNVRVLNNSWGQPGGSNIALKNTIEASGDAGILFVAAAGNGNILGQGVDNDRTPFYPASYDMDNVIAVGASDGTDRLAGFSNYGLRGVDFVAPGVGIRSTLPGGRYGEANGTSMATPHVSGSAALVWSLQPEASVAEIRRALLEQGDVIPALGSQTSTSRRLNANKSLAADVFAPTVQLVRASNITTAGGTEQLITVKYKNRLGVDKASLGNNDLLVTRQAALDETLTTTFVSSTENPSKTEVTAIYRLNAVGGTWDAEDYGNYLITAKSDAARSLSGLASRETTFGSFQVKIAAAGIFYVDTFLDTVDASVGNGQAKDSAGRTSLRAAIQEANALKPQPVKIFLQTGTYPLSIASVIDAGVNYPVPPTGSGYDAPTGLQWSNASSGDLDLEGNITLVGLGVNRTTIDAAGIDRVMKVYAGATASITGLTLTGGKAPTNHSGGAILNSGNLSLDLITIKNNEAIGGPVSLGGGIAHWNGNLNLYRSTLDSNQAIGGGGVFVTNGATAKIDSSALSDNFTDSRLLPDNNQFGGGALLTSLPGRTQVINSTLADNQAFGKATGDAIRNIPTFVGYDILFDSAASRDGRYAVYSYGGASLVDSDYFSDVFVLDLSTGISEIVSVNSDERKINSNSLATRQSISADGRYVIFESDGSNIDSLKTRDRNGIYLRDRQLGTTRRLGTSIDGKPLDGIFGSSTISSNGKFATFFSDASNLVPGDTPGTTNIFFLDLETFLVEQIDVSFDGVQSSTEMYPNLGSNVTFTSDDGRFVLFTSDAGNLVQGDNNRVTDVFIRDRKLKTTTLVSHALNSNSSGNNQSGSPLSNSNSEIDLSSDGRWVVYTSSSTNLVPGTTTPIASVYLYDAITGVNTLISRATDGSQGNGQSIKPRISSDASKIVYLTLSDNIVAKPTINTYDAVVYDINSGTSSRIPISGLARVPWSFSIDGDCENLFIVTNQSLSSQDRDGYDDLYQINLSSGNITLLSNNSQNVFSGVSSPVSDQSGATIAYVSSLATQVPDDTNNLSDVFVYDRTTNARKRISTGWDGSESNGNSSLTTISADGNVIAFRSTATNLVPNDTNGVADIFVFDRKSNLLTRLLVGNTSQSDINSFPFALSGDGKSLLLESTFSGYVVGDSNSARDVFVCDIATGTLRLVSRSQDGTAGNLSSSNASISFDGRFVSFVSDSSNLVDGDSNGLGDVFRADLSGDVIQRISLSFSGGQVLDAGSITSGVSYRTSISGDGRFVAFKSMSAQIAIDDVNTFPDVFLYDGKEKKTLLVSSSQGGIPGSGESGNATLSMDGKFLAFTSTAADIPIRGVAFDASVFVFSRELNYTEALGISSPSTDEGPQGIVISPFSSSSRFIARSGRSLLEVDLANREISAMTQFVLQDANVVVRSTTIVNSRADEFSGYEQTVSGPLVVQESILPEVEAALTPSSRTLILPTTVVDSVYASWKDLHETTNDTGVKSFSGGVNSRMYRMGNPLMRISLDQHGSARKVTPDIGSVETVGSRVSGQVYVDADRDSQKDSSENRPSGFNVFLDANHNGIHDPGELASVTGTGNSNADQGDGQGSFVFEDVPNGQYAVVVSLNGSVITNSEYPIESLDQFSPIQPVSISGDGRFVAFASAQANLVIGDRNRKTDIFVMERATGILRRVSVSSDGLESDGDSSFPSLSYDGSVVAFHSAASNLVENDTNGFTDTFIRDLKNSTTVRVNTTPTGVQANGLSLGRPILSQLGDSVAFISSANNLDPADVNTRDDWFVRNLSVNSLERIQPIDSAFRELPYSNTRIENASFSGDLSKVVFISASSALVSGDTNNVADVFLLNRSMQVVTRVSVHSNGEQGNGVSVQRP